VTVTDHSEHGLLSSLAATQAKSTLDSTAPTVTVLPATEHDRDYVVAAFTEALSPYYGGDHAAHARRVHRTHLDGGSDRRGLLSTRQLLLILWHGDQRCGVLNLVFKRQDTCKISPLLLYPASESNRGLGNVLMEAAVAQANRARARHLYCTVAESNQDTLQFFLQRGFAICGRAEGQYKDGETEVLLRRPLAAVVTGDQPTEESIISVSEVRGEQDWRRIRDLLLLAMTPQVDGADQLWLDALAGWTRQWPTVTAGHFLDHSVYCARDRSGSIRAAAIATRKKGDSIKVMPVAASDAEAFKALVVDLPSLLEGKGRKAYIHLSPDADQVAILQESSWVFEAQIPGAYSRLSVAQQWGCRLGRDAPLKTLRIHNGYLQLIENGSKTLEIRVGYPHIKSIEPGSAIKLMSRNHSLRCQVIGVRRYETFAEMLGSEDVGRALPGMSAAEALARLRQIYPAEKERLGVVVLQLDPHRASDEVRP